MGTDISKTPLLKLNAFPLWAVSIHVKFPGASIFILVEKKKNHFNLLKFSLNFSVKDRLRHLALRDILLFPRAALALCKHWGSVWHLALSSSFIFSISHQLDSESKKKHISKANRYGVTLKYCQNTIILIAD